MIAYRNELYYHFHSEKYVLCTICQKKKIVGWSDKFPRDSILIVFVELCICKVCEVLDCLLFNLISLLVINYKFDILFYYKIRQCWRQKSCLFSLANILICLSKVNVIVSFFTATEIQTNLQSIYHYSRLNWFIIIVYYLSF